MSKPIRRSMTTRKNWLIDASVFIGGVAAALSGVLFLFLPSGGYQGGVIRHTGSPSSYRDLLGARCAPGEVCSCWPPSWSA
jgi:hypothetical protein